VPVSGAAWTPEEVAYIEAHHPAYVASTSEGRRVVTITRAEAEHLAARYPTMLARAARVPVAGETAEEAALRARYPSMR
jgi:hypothetical protein